MTKKMISFLTDLIFPKRCPVCGEICSAEEQPVCFDCRGELSFVSEPVCKKCGIRLIGDEDEYCPTCMRYKRSFEEGRALIEYNEAAKRSMAAVKYGSRREYMGFYAGMMADRFHDRVAVWAPDVIVPIPVHAARMRKRGYNQAHELARQLSEKWGIPEEKDLLIRVKKTRAQRELGAAQRHKNMEGAFAVNKKVVERLGGMPARILLADDIYTTGATMQAASGLLLSGGAEKIYCLSVCISHSV